MTDDDNAPRRVQLADVGVGGRRPRRPPQKRDSAFRTWLAELECGRGGGEAGEHRAG